MCPQFLKNYVFKKKEGQLSKPKEYFDIWVVRVGVTIFSSFLYAFPKISIINSTNILLDGSRWPNVL